MKRLHLSILALFSWFFVFYNVERVLESANLASFIYLLAPALGMAVLLVPQLLHVRLYWYIPLSVASVVALRSLLGYEFVGPAYSLAVTESLAIWITVGLSYQLARGIEEYQSAAATAVCSHLADRCRPFEDAQAEIIREVRRARHFNRPVAVLALKLQPQDEQQTLDRFTDEFKKRLLRQYVSARAVECLSTHLQHHDILTETKDEFVVLLPELGRDAAMNLARAMHRDLQAKIGIGLRFGISMFPQDEVTAIGLIQRAKAESESVMAAITTALAATGPASPEFAPLDPLAEPFGKDRRIEPLPR